MLAQLVRWFIRWACTDARVYRAGHLLHADGSPYMRRWGLFETPLLSARVHEIVSDDLDRVLHDHPWNFLSLILAGGYFEMRPQGVEPAWLNDSDMERCSEAWRGAGSAASRRATDRHRIVGVLPGTYSLFIYSEKIQWWGFYTRQGKIHWRDYESCHSARRPQSGGD